jgi:hypothetical protein
MSWQCHCGITNEDSSINCQGCGLTLEETKKRLEGTPTKEKKERPKILSTAWDAFRRARNVVITVTFLLLLIEEAGVFLLSYFAPLDSLESQTPFPTRPLFVHVGSVIMVLFRIWVFFGIVRVALDYMRGFDYNQRRLITPLSDSLSAFMALIVGIALLGIPLAVYFFLGSSIGPPSPNNIGLIGLISIVFLLLLITGYYLFLRWSQVYFLVLDRRASFFDAFRFSAKMTRKKKGFLFIYMMIVPLLIGILAEIVSKALSEPTILRLIAEYWGIMSFIFIEFVGAAVYKELLTRLPRVSDNEQVESSGVDSGVI